MRALVSGLPHAIVTILLTITMVIMSGCKTPSGGAPDPKLTASETPACTNQTEFSFTCTAVTPTVVVNPTVKLNGTPMTAGVLVSSNPTKNTDGTFSTSITVKAGQSHDVANLLKPGQPNDFDITIKDANNKTAALRVTVNYLPSAPAITLPKDNQVTRQADFVLPVSVSGSGLILATVYQNGSKLTDNPLTNEATFSLNTTLTEAVNTFEVKAVDCAGNQGSARLNNIVLDTTAPEITFLTTPPSVPVSSPAYSFQFTTEASAITTAANYGTLITLTANGTSNGRTTYTASTNLHFGTNGLTVKSVDALGNIKSMAFGDVVYDLVPVITLSQTGSICTKNPDFAFNADVTATSAVTTTVMLNDSKLLEDNGRVPQDGSLPFTQTIGIPTFGAMHPGPNSFSITSKDAFNLSSAPATLSVTYVPSGPVLTLGQSDHQYLRTAAFALPITIASEGSVNTTVLQNGAQIAQSPEKSFTVNATLAAHTNTFEVRTTDCVGNQSTARLTNINLSTSGPLITLNANPAEAIYSTPYNLAVSIDAETAISTVISLRGEQVATSIQTTFQAPLMLNPGPNRVRIVSTDLAGNSTTREFDLTYLQVTTVGSGVRHTCAVINGGVQCWGDNEFGQLGRTPPPAFPSEEVPDSSVVASSRIPLPVPGLESGVTALAVGGFHNCAIRNGSLLCWGTNQAGETGTGGGWIVTPPALAIASGVTSVSAGYEHTCAIVNGNIWCWGFGQYGRLGLGDNGPRLTPTQVSGVYNPSAIAAGGEHTCSSSPQGMQCWGHNQFHQLGFGPSDQEAQSYVPAWIGIMLMDNNYGEIASGGFHSCGSFGGQFICWGYNGRGELGDPNVLAETSVTVIPSVQRTAHGFTLGLHHSCALQDGIPICWGDNTYGQLGLNSSDVIQRTPTAVPGLSGISVLSAGWNQTCAVSSNGLYCWGKNDYGQVANSIEEQVRAPQRVVFPVSGGE